MRNGVPHRVNEDRKFLRAIRRRKVNWIGHILRRNSILKDDIVGKIAGRIDGTGR